MKRCYELEDTEYLLRDVFMHFYMAVKLNTKILLTLRRCNVAITILDGVNPCWWSAIGWNKHNEFSLLSSSSRWLNAIEAWISLMQLFHAFHLVEGILSMLKVTKSLSAAP